MRLLLAEDNRELAHWLEKALVQEGFAVDCVSYDPKLTVRCILTASRIFCLLLASFSSNPAD